MNRIPTKLKSKTKSTNIPESDKNVENYLESVLFDHKYLETHDQKVRESLEKLRKAAYDAYCVSHKIKWKGSGDDQNN